MQHEHVPTRAGKWGARRGGGEGDGLVAGGEEDIKVRHQGVHVVVPRRHQLEGRLPAPVGSPLSPKG